MLFNKKSVALYIDSKWKIYSEKHQTIFKMRGILLNDLSDKCQTQGSR